jgi:hypothetical protein
MNVENLKERINELPASLIVTKVHIETINKHGLPLTIEYTREVDELAIIKQGRLSIGNLRRFINNLKIM